MATGFSAHTHSVPNFGSTLFRNNLECPLCTQLFTNPKDLECGHTFCESCLREIITRNASCKRISCPTCRHPTVPPLGSEQTVEWINGLKTNIALLKLVGFLHRKEPDDSPDDSEIKKGSESEGEIHSRYEDDRQSVMCFIHRRMPFKFFCKEHSVLLCVSCKKIHERSCRSVLIEDHATQAIVEARTMAQQQEMARMKCKLETALKEVSTNQSQLKDQFNDYAKQLDDLEKDFHDLFAELKSKLKPKIFASITEQQQEQLNEIQSLLAVIDVKTNEIHGISDYRDYSGKFIALTIQQDQSVVIESAVTAATENLTSVNMRHVGIDVMTSLTKLGSEYLSEVQWKTTKLERRHCV